MPFLSPVGGNEFHYVSGVWVYHHPKETTIFFMVATTSGVGVLLRSLSVSVDPCVPETDPNILGTPGVFSIKHHYKPPSLRSQVP